MFLRDSTITTVVCNRDNIALGVIASALRMRSNGLTGLLLVSSGNTPEVSPYVLDGTVVVTMDLLTSSPHNGLAFGLNRTLDRLEGMLRSGEAPLNTAKASRALGLGLLDANSSAQAAVMTTGVLPVVPNIDSYIIRSILTNYDVNSPPYAGFLGPADRAPVPVEVQYSIDNLKVENGKVYFKGNLRLFWNDPRLRWDVYVPIEPNTSRIVTLRSSTVIWTPDAYLWVPQGSNQATPGYASPDRVLFDPHGKQRQGVLE